MHACEPRRLTWLAFLARSFIFLASTPFGLSVCACGERCDKRRVKIQSFVSAERGEQHNIQGEINWRIT